MKLVSGRFNLFLSSTLIFFIFVSAFSFWTQNFKRDLQDSACGCTDFSGILDLSENTGLYEGQEFEIPKIANEKAPDNVLGTSDEEKWIEVDLSEQKLRAWQGGSLFLETLISSGLPKTPTPTGDFRIWIKLRATRMRGGVGRYYYNLPNVPYVMYFGNDKVPNWKGYGLHGTYWHHDFGHPRSHGCVNLPTEIAAKLYSWTTPGLSPGKNSVRADSSNPGTRIVIHD